MSRQALHLQFARTDAAQAIAPVFVSRPKGKRRKLDVHSTFNGHALHWYGEEALDITDQSVMFGLLCLAAQGKRRVDPAHPGPIGERLLRALTISGSSDAPHPELVAVKASWNRLIAASGYASIGGQHLRLVKASLQRLADTTLKERFEEQEYASRLLSWTIWKDGAVWVLFNRRASMALYPKHQHSRISLAERYVLSGVVARAMHAYLSGFMGKGGRRSWPLTRLESAVWGATSEGSAAKGRHDSLRSALAQLDTLPRWSCQPDGAGRVCITFSPGR